MKILIVEHDGLIALVLERIVRAAGHDVIGPVSSVEQALAYASRAEIVLVDIGLSDGDSGVRLARQLMDRLDVKVLFVTESTREVGFGLEGSVVFVSKPFSNEQIFDAIAKLYSIPVPSSPDSPHIRYLRFTRARYKRTPPRRKRYVND